MTETIRRVEVPAYGDPQAAVLAEVPTPRPAAGRVLVRVGAAAVNPADLKRVRGMFGDDPASLPLHLGSEVAGVVEAIGEPDADGAATTPFGPVHVGDAVIAYPVVGGWADAVVAKVENLLLLPAGFVAADGAALMVAATTASHLIVATEVRTGDRVIVHGASGSVGAAAVQLLVDRGADVVGTAGPSNLDYVASLGATPVRYGDGLLERLRAVLPDGADAAFDTVGTAEAIETSLALGVAPTRVATIANFTLGAERGILRLGGGAGADPGGDIRKRARAGIIDAASRGVLRVRVAARVPLDRVRDALTLVDSGHPGGKVVLEP